MIKKIILLIGMFLLSNMSVFANNKFYYGENCFIYDNNKVYDCSNNVIDSHSNFISGVFSYDSGLKKYYIRSYNTNSSTNYYVTYINNNGTFGNNVELNINIGDYVYNSSPIANDSYMDGLGYNRFSNYFSSIGEKPLYYNGNNDILLKNNSGGVNSINFGVHPYNVDFIDLDGKNVAFSQKLSKGKYIYKIFSEDLSVEKYSSPEIILTGGPSSCEDFSSNPMNYDICNNEGFNNYCAPGGIGTTEGVCGNIGKLKYNTKNKIYLESKYDSFSEENSYLKSYNTLSNINIDGYFIGQFVWNSDLSCEIFVNDGGINPLDNCSNGVLIRNGNSLVCNPNLTHKGVTYASSYFPFYNNESDVSNINYNCGAIKNGKNGETIETLSDDTKGFWQGLYDNTFKANDNDINDLNKILSGSLKKGSNGFSIGTGGTSIINFVPGNNNYGNILNKNEKNLTCDMFNKDGSFAYYSNGSYDFTINLNNILDLNYSDKIPYLEELLFIPDKILSFITNPMQNIFSILRVFGGIGENTYCYFGTLQTIEFQKHIKIGTSYFRGDLIFTPGTLTIIDYLVLFFVGIPLLIITVRILLY